MMVILCRYTLMLAEVCVGVRAVEFLFRDTKDVREAHGICTHIHEFSTGQRLTV